MTWDLLWADYFSDPLNSVDAEPYEPAEQQIIWQLFHQLPLGADREQDFERMAQISRSGGIEGQPKSV